MVTLWVATTQGTVELMQSVKYFPTRCLQELEDVGGKSFQCSKQSVSAIGQQASEPKATTGNSLPNSALPPSQSKGRPLISIVFYFNLS